MRYIIQNVAFDICKYIFIYVQIPLNEGVLFEDYDKNSFGYPQNTVEDSAYEHARQMQYLEFICLDNYFISLNI